MDSSIEDDVFYISCMQSITKKEKILGAVNAEKNCYVMPRIRTFQCIMVGHMSRIIYKYGHVAAAALHRLNHSLVFCRVYTRDELCLSKSPLSISHIEAI